MTHNIILDTDIGDDIDDALALGLICCRPEIALKGVTTVFGNVAARSRQARTILKLAGGHHANVPVAAGCGASLASRPKNNLENYLSGSLPSQDGSCLPESELPMPDKRHGVDFLIDTIMANSGDITLVTIGAMTNIALAITKEPKIVAKIPKIVAMAAEPKFNFAEWNIECDPEAASIVLNSDIPMEIITWEMGHKVRFTQQDVEQLANIHHPLANNLSAAIAFWQNGDTSQMPSLYDPLTIIAILEPSFLNWRQGRVKVELSGDDTYGHTKFKPDDTGPHRVANDVDRARAISFYFDSLKSIA